VRRSGIFALSEVADLAFVYVPPLSRTLELGVSAMLVAATFCRERRAILIVDPPAAWDSPNKALTGLKQLNFYSDNAVMFFPRIIAMDRLRGRSEVFGNGGAVAGLLSRSGEAVAAAITHVESEPLLRAGTRLAHEVEVTDRVRLAANGINVLQAVRSVDRNRPALRTLACGASASSDWAYLAARRFALFVVNAIVRGTRWSAATPKDPFVWARVVRQVRTFLEELRSNGAFANVPQEDAFLVICDERINDVPEADDEQPTALNILVQFAANHVGDYHSYMITHDAHGSSVRVIAVNRMQAGLRVAVELQQEVTIRLPSEDLLRLASL
jgi:phage tail sheath protein FI